MINAIASLSGLSAAGNSIANRGNKIANLHSTTSLRNGVVENTPFQPQDQVNTSLEPNGGVKNSLRPRDPASVSYYDPENVAADANGITQYPNVSLEEEMVGLQVDAQFYKANLKAFKAQDEMTKSVLDIIS